MSYMISIIIVCVCFHVNIINIIIYSCRVERKEVQQTEDGNEKEIILTSQLNLVDLAGCFNLKKWGTKLYSIYIYVF